jgi:hypothetical protein
MRETTKHALEELASAEWFRAVGRELTGEDVSRACGWTEATQSYLSQQWEDILLEFRERYRGRLFRACREKWDSWNELVKEIEPAANALTSQRLQEAVGAGRLPKEVAERLKYTRYVVFNFALECELSEYVPPGFFSELARFHRLGHFPCGWDGEALPPQSPLAAGFDPSRLDGELAPLNGRLIVY